MNNDTDMIVEVVDHTADRPVFSDRGDSVVPEQNTDEDYPAKPPRKDRMRKKRPRKASAMSDEDLIAESGVEPVFSTSEAAEFFDRSNQWLYWGLREGVFTDEDGEEILPERIGDPKNGRRRFTIPILKEIMKSSYRRGNFDGEQLKVIMRRIKYAEQGVEWREREGWRYAHLGRNRYRWHKRNETFWDSSAKEWKVRPEVKPRGEG